MSETISRRTEPVTPTGVNHLVLNVRDMEESHHFWSGLLGFKQVGKLKPRGDGIPSMNMQFYSGVVEDVNHHDLALVERQGLPEPPDQWSMFEGTSAVNHIAITYPDRDSWLEQVQFLKEHGVPMNLRVDHGMTHSVYVNDPNGYGVEVLYELPEEIWKGDIDGALNYAVLLPEEELLTFDLAPGYVAELVAAEPQVQEPVLTVFDGNGVMYVAEMRSYMQDVAGTGTKTLKNGRIKRLEDTDGDGKMDRVTTFVDQLNLPRMILPLDDRIAVRETETVLRVNSRQVAVLGGLMQDARRRADTGVPGLSDLQEVGALFEYRDTQSSKSELVIFVRPTVVRSASVDGDLSSFRPLLPENIGPSQAKV